MPLDLTTLSDDQLKNLIENHRRQGKLSAPNFLAASAEYERRKGRGLDFEKSLAAIRAAASQGRCLSYKDLADESGAEWSKVHYEMNNHLGRLIEYAHGKGWPLLSAVVVNKPHVASRDMEPKTLKGFVNAARLLGYSVTDDRQFLRDQQDAVFAWAKGTSE